MRYLKLIPVLLISSLVIAACSSKKADKAAESNTASEEKAAVAVKVMDLARTKIARTIEYTATVLPYEEVNVVPSSPGRIDKIYVEIGDKVRKGDNLFLMDRTQLYQQKVQLEGLFKDLCRLDTLLRTGSVKQQQYDQLKTQYDVTKTNVDFMEENTLLKSPFKGIITGKYFEDGEMYSGTPTTAGGRSAVVSVMQVDPLKLDVNVSEQYYPLIKKGMKVKVAADVYEGDIFDAEVFRIAPTISSATRSFTVEMELRNRNNLLRPGMFVRVKMDLGEVDSFVVPASTILVQEGTNTRYVFIADNNIAKRIEVTIGQRFDDKIEVLSDEIKTGDKLINEGQAKLINGDIIEIAE